jgi:3-oxoacyl-[acyl-carrier protein] reductase
MELGLNGKTALITGSSKGIGLSVAEVFAGEGCHVHLAARTEADLVAAADGIRGAHNVRVETHAADLSVTADLEALAAACPDIDILVNNAGAIPRGTLAEMGDETLRQSWELKLFGYINLTRIVYAAMVERGRGVIINVIGGAAENPRHDYIAGTMANVALSNFCKALGKESTKNGVRVVGIHPGLTKTERMISQHEYVAGHEFGDPSRWEETLPPAPFSRPAEPEEVAYMVAFYASERASYTSGTVVSISGGV